MFAKKLNRKNMKSKSFFLTLLMALFLVSCKGDNQPKTEETPKEEVKKFGFVITLNAVVPKNDNFELIYRETEQMPYEEATLVSTAVTGSPEPQNIVFGVAESDVPNFIRLDYGTNKEQGEILIKSLTIDYHGKKFVMNGKEFFNYIMINTTNLKADLEKVSLTPFVSADGGYDPMSYSEKPLFEEIQKLQQ